MGRVEHSNRGGLWIVDDDGAAGLPVVAQERVVQANGEDRALRRVRGGDTFGEEVRVLSHERRGRTHGVVLGPVDLGREAELPAPCSPSDRELILVVDVDPRGGEDPAVVGATGPGAMLVDRAFVVDQHRAVTVLVVAEDDVAAGPSRCREQ